MVGLGPTVAGCSAPPLRFSSKPGWRDGATRPQAPARGKQQGGRPHWLDHRPGPQWDSAAARIAAGLLLAAVVPALLAAWIFLFPDRRPTPLLVVTVAEYAAPVPPNAFAAEDGLNFQSALADYDNVRLTAAEAPRNSVQMLAAVEGFLQRATAGGPQQNVALIYLSAHGLVNDQGAPCLLLPEHDPLDAATWLPLADLLQAINQAAASKNCTAVVMLDAQRIDDQWRLGIPANTFSLALEDWITVAPLANCIVLAASTGLQQSVAAPELSATPFGYFVIRGIRGEADREGNTDAVVTLAELEQFVSRHTSAWTARYRGRAQRPQLLGGDSSELLLADVADDEDAPPLSPQSAKSAIEPAAFTRLYDRIGALERARLFAQRPMEWNRITYLLERLHAEATAGRAYARVASAGTLPELNATLASAESDPSWPYQVHAPSLAVRQRIEGAANLNSLSESWKTWLEDPSKAQPPADYTTAAAFTWRELSSGAASIDRDQLTKRLEFCRQGGVPDGADFIEMALLRLLAAGVDWESPALARGVPGQLLAARGEAESLAAAADARLHYLLGGRLRGLDQQWNAALDGVLVGNDASLHESNQQLAKLMGAAEGSYPDVGSQSQALLHALQVRDQALATAAELVQLSVERAAWSAEQRADHAQLDAIVRDALALSHELDEAMADDQVAATSNSPLTSLAARLESNLNAQAAAYAEMVERIATVEGGSQQDTALETPPLLECMMGFNQARARLHEQWFARVSSAAVDHAASADAPAADREQELDYLRWCAAAGIEPVRRLLADPSLGLSPPGSPPTAGTAIDSESSPSDVLKSLAEFNGLLRRSIRRSQPACQALIDGSRSKLADAPAAQARIGCSQADVLARAFGPLAGPHLRFASQETPAELLEKLDIQAWLAWQGERLVADCWGSLAMPSAAADPYFATAAGRLAEDIERLNSASFYDARELRSRMESMQQLLAQWKPLAADDLFVADERGGLLSHHVVFQGQPNMAPGVAAVFLTKANGQLFTTYTATALENRRMAADLLQDVDLSTQLRPDSINDVSLLHANVLFRGHVRQEVFSIGRGVVVDWQRPPLSEAAVVVRGDSKQVSQIVFVVDCSYSMLEGDWDKLQQGVEVLQRILDGLVSRDEKFRMALLFYGRRAGWKDRFSAEVKRLPDVPYSGQPGSDVEVALELTPLNSRVAEDVKALLRKAKPHGETPLYLALVRALDQFDLGDPGPCHLIAITDGVNEVAPDQPLADQDRKTFRDVIRALAPVKDRVKLDIVEFGGKQAFATPAEERRWNTGRDELKQIVDSIAPAGSFRLAANADSLTDELQASLRLDRYRVQPAGAAAVTADPWQEFGQPVRLGPLETPQRFDVVLQTHRDASAALELEGGESIEIRYQRPPDNRLLFPVYDADDRRGPPQTVGGVLVAAHMPRLQLSDPVFRVSVQSGDERRFSPRPALIWCQIQPADQRDSPPHYFFDSDFEPGLPVPMLNFRAHGWTDSRFARLELYLAMEEASIEAPWSAIPPIGSTAAELHGARLDVRSEIAGNGVQVVVEEQHPTDAPHFPLHIQLDPPPDAVSRTFFQSKHLARHVFRYAVQPANPRMRALTRREIEAAGGRVLYERIELPRR